MLCLKVVLEETSWDEEHCDGLSLVPTRQKQIMITLSMHKLHACSCQKKFCGQEVFTGCNK